MSRRRKKIVRRAQIARIEYYLPEQVLENEELARLFPDWTPEAIEEKLGIRTRHIAAPGETAADMAVEAARKLFDRGGSLTEEIDFVILCTQSPDHLLPSSACLIQDRLGIPKSTGAFDFNLGCSGFVYGLALARGLIETGLADNVLLLTADTYSKYISPTDRATRPLFGDAAAATLIRAVEDDQSDGPLTGPFVFGTDGSGADQLIVPAGGHRLPASPETAIERTNATGAARSQNHLHMDGPGIFSFSLKTVPPLVDQLLARGRLAREDVDWYVFHQANSFMLEALRAQCGLDKERFAVEVQDKGNTVSSSIPIALCDIAAKGAVRPGARAMLVGFGVGLSWAGALAVLPGGL